MIEEDADRRAQENAAYIRDDPQAWDDRQRWDAETTWVEVDEEPAPRTSRWGRRFSGG
jgi:hypothetical protein